MVDLRVYRQSRLNTVKHSTNACFMAKWACKPLRQFKASGANE